jgi:hypothetical protein
LQINNYCIIRISPINNLLRAIFEKNYSFFVYFFYGKEGLLAECETAKNSPKALSLNEAITKNLLQQPAIRVALYNISVQQGVAQSSGAPFDPVTNDQIFHTYSRDLLNLNPLDNEGVIDVVPEVVEPNPCLQQISSAEDVFCPEPIYTDKQAHETTLH